MAAGLSEADDFISSLSFPAVEGADILIEDLNHPSTRHHQIELSQKHRKYLGSSRIIRGGHTRANHHWPGKLLIPRPGYPSLYYDRENSTVHNIGQLSQVHRSRGQGASTQEPRTSTL